MTDGACGEEPRDPGATPGAGVAGVGATGAGRPDAVRLVGVTRRFGPNLALDAVSLSVAPGERLALVGPSGCGKSTLLRVVAGLLAPDAGEVWVGGVPFAGDGAWVPPERRAVGVVFQDLALFPHLDVEGNVAFGLRRMPRRDRRDAAARALALVHGTHLAGRYPHELSGGERQRVALARALAPGPGVVLLDEPFSAVDPALRDALRDDLLGALGEAGVAAVVVTHDRVEALVSGDRVAVLRAGRLEQWDRPEVVFERPATAWVAGFVGGAQLLAARPGGPGRFRTAFGELAAEPVGSPAPAGEGWQVAARAAQVGVEADAGSAVEVAECRFEGERYRYVLRAPDGAVAWATGPEPLAAGTPVRVVAAGQLRAYPAADDGEDAGRVPGVPVGFSAPPG